MTRRKKNPVKILLFVLSAVLLAYIFYTLPEKENNSVTIINKSEINDSISKDSSIKEIVTKEKEGNVNIEIINEVKSGDNLSSILKKHQIEDKAILIIAEQEEIDFNFNNLQIGQKYKVILNNDSVLISFNYQATSTKVYSIIFTDPLKYTSEEGTITEVKTENVLVEKKENKMIEQTSKDGFVNEVVQIDKNKIFGA